MLIEVIGLCGSGKTTLLNRVNKSIDNNDLIVIPKCRNKVLGYLYVFSFILKIIFNYPKVIILYFSSFRWLLLKLCYRYYNNFSFINCSKECIPLDRGLLMPLIQYQTSHNIDDVKFDVKKLLNILPLPKKVIYLNTDYQTSIKQHTKRDKLKVNKQYNYNFSIADTTLKEILYFLYKKKVDIIEIDKDIKAKSFIKVIKEKNVKKNRSFNK